MDSRDKLHFEELLAARLPTLTGDLVLRISQFRELVLAENEVQNLTRLISPHDFLEGHVLDVWELLKSGLLRFPAMDLGSGVGVPGLLAAIFGSGPWILCESEGRKAEFLKRTVAELGLSAVSVFAERGEDVLRSQKVESVVVRAVGRVEKIYSWLKPCSTWNNLVLFKGPRWEAEWEAFEKSKQKGRLLIQGDHKYQVAGAAGEDELKKRLIVSLVRSVPRGTEIVLPK